MKKILTATMAAVLAATAVGAAGAASAQSRDDRRYEQRQDNRQHNRHGDSPCSWHYSSPPASVLRSAAKLSSFSGLLSSSGSPCRAGRGRADDHPDQARVPRMPRLRAEVKANWAPQA